MGPSIVYLVRHGEVANPDHVVYASLPGFGLSDLGRDQAAAAAARLAGQGVSAVISSPLQRALETASIIATALHLPVSRDDRLREWELGERWAGTRWSDLDERYPGEVAAYLDHPHDLSFTPETLHAVARRMTGVVAEAATRDAPDGIVLVSHQDPIQAGRLALTDRPLSALQVDKPGHGSIVTLTRPAGRQEWRELDYWEHDQGPAFPPIETTPDREPGAGR